MGHPSTDRRHWLLGAALLALLCGPGKERLGAATFVRGDSNQDGIVDIADPTFTLNHLFLGAPDPRCLAAADANDDEAVDISDALATLGFLFLGTGKLPPPWPGPGVDPTPGLPCGSAASNRPPTLTVQSPAPGTVIDAPTVDVRGRVSDDGSVIRIVAGGGEATPPGPPAVPYSFSAAVPLPPGPSLLRVEAVDDFGRAAFREIPVGRAPILLRGAPASGLALHLGPGGYDEMETIVRPFLDVVPALIDTAIRGRELYRGSVLGVDIRVTGNRVEVGGAVGLDLFPTAEAGGRLGLRATLEQVLFFADGRSDFGFLGTDAWDATWRGNGVSMRGTFALTPLAGGVGLDVVSDGFVAEIASSATDVNGFLDPFGIFDGIVNFLAGLFREEIEAQVRAAVERAADEQIVPVLKEAFANLRLDLDLGAVSMTTRFDDALESGDGLAFLFDAAWDAAGPGSPTFPAFPGSSAGFAPFPTFPLPGAGAADATISVSSDTLQQALLEVSATGIVDATMDLSEVEAPVPLVAGTIASILDPRLLDLPGVHPDDPLGVRIRAEAPAEIQLGGGAFGRPIVGEGAPWRYFKGTAEPPASWKSRTFDDSSWTEGLSGFGYSSDETELVSVRTRLADMSGGYVSVFARTRFTVANPAALRGILLSVQYDDGFVAFLNGVEVARANVTGSPPSRSAVADGTVERTRAEVDLTPRRSLLVAGENVLAVQGHNAAATSSDFLLVPELLEPVAPSPGTIGSLPVTVEMRELTAAFLADTKADGVGETDADGVADEVELFALKLGIRLRSRLCLERGGTGAPTLMFQTLSDDGPDPDGFPDAIVGGAAGLGIGVAREAVDLRTTDVVAFAELVLALLGPSVGEALTGFELPSFPLPELNFDLDEDGTPDVRLDIVGAALVPVDTTGDGRPDWLAIPSDLRAVTLP